MKSFTNSKECFRELKRDLTTSKIHKIAAHLTSVTIDDLNAGIEKLERKHNIESSRFIFSFYSISDKISSKILAEFQIENNDDFVNESKELIYNHYTYTLGSSKLIENILNG